MSTANVKQFRTVLHGTCLLGGHHPEGSPLARECPILRRQKRHVQGGQGVDSGSLSEAPVDSLVSDSLQGGFRDAEDKPELPFAHHRNRGGRPATTKPSRQARYRRRHPEYQQREADRIKARRSEARVRGQL